MNQLKIFLISVLLFIPVFLIAQTHSSLFYRRLLKVILPACPTMSRRRRGKPASFQVPAIISGSLTVFVP